MVRVSTPFNLANAARYYRELPHQLAAWNWLSAQLPREVLNEFAQLYRSAPSPPPVPPWLPPALKCIKRFEGCVLDAYPDPETGDSPWTIGYGSTAYENGAAVKRGDRITQDRAERLLSLYAERLYSGLATKVPNWNRLSPYQQAAMVSFTYNCGPGWYGLASFKTLSACFREGRLSDVPAALQLYINPGGPSELGLKRRRLAEAALFAHNTTDC